MKNNSNFVKVSKTVVLLMVFVLCVSMFTGCVRTRIAYLNAE